MNDAELYLALGEGVAARRRALRKTQAEVASQLGLSRASLANIERGRQKVLLHQVYRLAAALDLDDVRKLLPLDTVARGADSATQRSAQAPAVQAMHIVEPESGLTQRQRAQIEALLAKAPAAKGGAA